MSLQNTMQPPTCKLPLALKLALAVFLAVLIPIYVRTYGPTNFLWFCDTTLLLTAIGVWFESQLLVSLCAVGILVPQILWLVDFGSHLLGFHLLNLTSYMFDSRIPIFIRGLSLFHGWLPVLVLWLVFRLRYSKWALWAWTAVAIVLVFACYLLTPAAGTHLQNPNAPINVNYLYGFNDQHPQDWMNEKLYVVLWFSALWLGAWLPTHLILRHFFGDRQASALTTPN